MQYRFKTFSTSSSMSDESFEFNFWRQVELAFEVCFCSQAQHVSAVLCKNISPYDAVGSDITPNELYIIPAEALSLPNFSFSPDLPILSNINLFEMIAKTQQVMT